MINWIGMRSGARSWRISRRKVRALFRAVYCMRALAIYRRRRCDAMCPTAHLTHIYMPAEYLFQTGRAPAQETGPGKEFTLSFRSIYAHHQERSHSHLLTYVMRCCGFDYIYIYTSSYIYLLPDRSLLIVPRVPWHNNNINNTIGRCQCAG